MDRFEQLPRMITEAFQAVADGKPDTMAHAELFDEYLELCKRLGVEPDPNLIKAYNEFLELYPHDGEGPVSA